MGTHQLGRGLRRNSREGQLFQGDVRARMHRQHSRHRPQHQLAVAVFRQCSLADAQYVHLRLLGVFLLHAAHMRIHGAVRRLPDCRCLRGARGPLRQSRMEGACRHRGVGQRAARFQRRRVSGALACGVRPDGLQDHLHRSAPDLVGCASRILAATASRDRCRLGVRLDPHDHRRRPVRPRLRRLLVRRLRRACRLREGRHPRMGCRDLRLGRRGRSGLGTAVCHGQARCDSMGTRFRPAALVHVTVPCRMRPHGAYRKPGRAWWQHSRAQRLRDQCGLRDG